MYGSLPIEKSPLADRDYVVAVDHSGSMKRIEASENMPRWSLVAEAVQGLARAVTQWDPDGIDLVLFDTDVTHHRKVNAEQVREIFERKPPDHGMTHMAGALELAFNDYFANRDDKVGIKGCTVIVVTDGAPYLNLHRNKAKHFDSSLKKAAKSALDQLRRAQGQLRQPGELKVVFFQVGQDEDATEFLNKVRAEFPTLATVASIDDMERKGLKKMLEETLQIT
ncbi:MAG: VWA domain-containing protein [Chlamydiia bacterium]|nr:VWA domain-containing protein [Chlamydiia bacterium]